MRKMTNKKGFTLMEMLIVIAIIAILVAIAIPTFNSSLNKARVAADEANIRAKYAEVMTEFITEGNDTAVSSGPIVMTGSTAEEGVNIAGITVQWEKGNSIYVHIDADGNVTINKTAPTNTTPGANS